MVENYDHRIVEAELRTKTPKISKTERGMRNIVLRILLYSLLAGMIFIIWKVSVWINA